MTFRQAQGLGGSVRKREHGSLVVFADSVTRIVQTDAGEDVERAIPFMRGYTVFNVEQIDGLPEAYYERPAAPSTDGERHAQAEAFIAATGAVLTFGGNQAFYAPSADRIQMPIFGAFAERESYYSTALRTHALDGA
jgi:antirestriction protein ArdC